MCRDIFLDRTNTTHGNKKMSFPMTLYFEEISSYFKLRNGWLNSKLCAKRKLLHSEKNAYVSFVKRETLKFVIEL